MNNNTCSNNNATMNVINNLSLNNMKTNQLGKIGKNLNNLVEECRRRVNYGNNQSDEVDLDIKRKFGNELNEDNLM